MFLHCIYVSVCLCVCGSFSIEHAIFRWCKSIKQQSIIFSASQKSIEKQTLNLIFPMPKQKHAYISFHVCQISIDVPFCYHIHNYKHTFSFRSTLKCKFHHRCVQLNDENDRIFLNSSKCGTNVQNHRKMITIFRGMKYSVSIEKAINRRNVYVAGHQWNFFVFTWFVP